MGMFDFLTPQRAAPAQQAAPGTQAGSAGPSNSAAQAQTGGGVGGWFRAAGSWVADRWDATTTAVSDFAARTGRVAKDMWEVAQTTDLSWKEGRLSVDTDLDEVMDLMPERVRSSLSLDREKSQNRVRLEFDRNTGAITASSDDLAIRSVNTSRLRTGAVHLTGARITLANPGGGLPGLDEAFSLPGYRDAADNLDASLSIDGMQAEDVEVQTQGGPLRVAGIQTGGLRAGVKSEQGMPFSDKGSSSAGFSVENALVRGVAGAGVAADELSVERAEAGISEGSETAFLETTGLAVKGGRQGERSLGDASVAHARVDVQNRGGGAVFLDDAADHVVADVAVSTAGVRDFDGGGARLGEGSLAGLRGRWTQDTGEISASADDLRAARLDTQGVDAGDVDLDGVKVELGPQAEGRRLDLRADAAKVDDLAVDPARGAPTGVGAEGGARTAPLALSGGLGRLTLNRARVGEGSVARLDARGLGVTGGLSNKGLSLKGELAEASAERLAMGQESVARLGVGGLSASLSEDAGVELAVTRAEAEGLRSRYGSLGSGSLRDGRLSLDDGALDARVGGAELRSLEAMNRASLERASLSGLSATLGRERQRLGLEAAELAGLRDRESGVSLERGDLRGLSASRGAAGAEATLAHLGGAGLGWRDRVGLESFQLEEVRASDAEGRREARFREMGMDGLSVAGVGDPSRIGQLYALDGALALEDGALSGRVATAEARDLRHADLSAAGVSAHDLSARVDPTTTAVSAGDARIDTLNARNFSADLLTAEGARASMSNGDMEATLERARAEQARVAGRLSLEQLTAEGVAASARGERRAVTVDSARATDLRDRPTGTRVAEGDLSGFSLSNDQGGVRGGFEGLALRDVATRLGGADTRLARLGAEDARLGLDGRGLDASLGRLTAADARLSAGLGGSRSGGSAGGGSDAGGSSTDTARLVRSLGAAVDDASLSATLPLRAGDLPWAPVAIREGTTATASLGLRDGALTRDSRVSLDKPLDGPLWVNVHGAYMDDRNRLMSDVSGWSDRGLSEHINRTLGLPGERMHDLATLTDAVADRMERPAGPSTGSSGGSSGPSAADLVDLDGLRARARVGLRAGTIDAGSHGDLTLGSSEVAGANTLDAQVTGRDRVVASFSDLLATAFRLNGAGGRVQGGQSELGGARVEADLRGEDASLDASLERADLRDLRLQSSQITLPTTHEARHRKPNS